MMKCEDLKVVNLNINEDNYEYEAIFRLCTENVCIDVNLEQLESIEMLDEIKRSFSITETTNEMKNIIMEKIMEASNLESRISEGESCCSDSADKEVQRKIDALSMS
jgi:chemotaxis response regulator CheB